MSDGCDVLILGGGLAGWSAALAAAERGASVTLTEDGMGASPWVHGFNAPCVREGDSPEVFLKDTLASAQGQSMRELDEALCADAPRVFRSLLEIGLPFNRDGECYEAIRPLGSSFARVVSVGNETGPAILNAYREKLKGKVRVIPHARALKMDVRDGVCRGALIHDGAFHRIAAKSTVLCCGGFCGIFAFTDNKRDSGGDGIAMAYEAGCRLRDLEMIQFEPSGAVWPEALIGTAMITTLFYSGAVLRNAAGERFMLRCGPQAEQVGKDVMARCICREILAGRGGPHGGVYMDLTGVDGKLLDEKYPMYVERYRNVGIDLKKEWIELAPIAHTALGGVTIDANGQTDVEGLFAAGEVTGGVHGANRLGGSGGLEPLVFGKRAGTSAAKRAENVRAPVLAEPVPAEAEGMENSLDAIRREMKKQINEGLAVIRTEEGMRAALRKLKELTEETDRLKAGDGAESPFRLRLKNDLLCGTLALTAALAREDSVGCHQRADRPEAPKTKYTVTVRRGKDGEAVTERNPVG